MGIVDGLRDGMHSNGVYRRSLGEGYLKATN